MKVLGQLLLFATTFFCNAQSADEILSKYFQAVGGLDKITSIKTMKTFGRSPTPYGDVMFTIYQKAPNLYRMEVDVSGTIMIPQAFDGSTAWALNPFGESPNAQKLPEDQALQVADYAELEWAFVNYANKGHSVSLEGKEQIDGLLCYKIKLVKNQFNEKEEIVEYHFFDIKSNVPILSRTISASGPTKGQETDTYISDYQELDNGLIQPFYFETKVDGEKSQSISIISIETNVEISDEIFEFKGN